LFFTAHFLGIDIGVTSLFLYDNELGTPPSPSWAAIISFFPLIPFTAIFPEERGTPVESFFLVGARILEADPLSFLPRATSPLFLLYTPYPHSLRFLCRRRCQSSLAREPPALLRTSFDRSTATTLPRSRMSPPIRTDSISL